MGLMLTFSCGCVGTSANLNKVHLGMTKSEVIEEIGRPDSVSAEAGIEYLIYDWANPKEIIANESERDRYFILLKDGEVDSYGEVGDLGSEIDLPRE